MATDWIKMRTDLYRDPKVIVMADLLCEHNGPLSRYVNQHNQCDMSVTQNVTRCAVVGGLVAVWGVARHRGKRVGDDLLIEGATLDVLDSVSELPGFGEVMSVVGWAVDYTQGVIFPRFFAQHNVDPEDQKREQAAARKRRQRERDMERDKSVTVTHREEKRREEKSIEEEIHIRGDNATVCEADKPDESESDDKPEAGVNPGDFQVAWNRCPGLVPIHRMTAKRKRALKTRSRDPAFVDGWQDGIRKIAASDFCCGNGSTGWRADCDWFLRPESLTRIMEGKYDNRTGTTGNNPKQPTYKNESDRRYHEQLRLELGDELYNQQMGLAP